MIKRSRSKRRIWIDAGFILTFVVILYLGGKQQRDARYSTLNADAVMPDEYLLNVAYYEEHERHAKSASNLEQAIQSIWKLEAEVDDESFEKLEAAIQRLEQIHKKIMRGSVDPHELKIAFEYALNNLAYAELKIAEICIETDHLDEANLAIKYGQLHIKNAILFHDDSIGDTVQLAIEEHVFDEMDSLLKNQIISSVQQTTLVEKMIKEVDVIISRP